MELEREWGLMEGAQINFGKELCKEVNIPE
jgi:hypothetical protein